MKQELHKKWLESLLGDDSMRTASEKIGLAQTTISRQLSRGALSPEMVMELSRAYGLSPITGLVQTGYIHEWERVDIDVPASLGKATNQQILAEILKRSDPEARSLFGASEGEDIVDAELGQIVEFPTYDVGSARYAANKRKPEPTLGDDDYGPGA